jgi:hypothetical protein
MQQELAGDIWKQSMKVWGGTPYAKIFKGSRSLASTDVLKNPSLSEALKEPIV